MALYFHDFTAKNIFVVFCSCLGPEKRFLKSFKRGFYTKTSTIGPYHKNSVY